MYQPHLLTSIEAADRMRELQARWQRRLTLALEKANRITSAPTVLSHLRPMRWVWRTSTGPDIRPDSSSRRATSEADTGAEAHTRISTRHPLSFDEEAAEAGVTSRVALGVRPIRVRRIVGSAGKAGTIGPDFLPPRRGRRRKSYHDILRRMQDGESLPPITVYQLGARYFVIDGHTRVAAARTLGIEFIDAEVIEALPRKEGDANLTYYARRAFEGATGLEGIRLTAPWRYPLLQEHVEGYRLYLERSLERDVSLPAAARVWYRAQYLPTISEIYRRKLASTSGGHTAGDVYTDVLKAWSEEGGSVVSLREMLDRYDESLPRDRLQRVERQVAAAMDAALPKAVPPLTMPRAARLTELDVKAELDAL